MREFAANLSILFPTLPYLDRFRKAAEAGFESVESWWPVDELSAGMTPDDLLEQAERYGLRTVLLNFAAGDLRAGDRGLAGDPERAEAFRLNVPVAINIARRLGCRKLNALAGNLIAEADRSRQLEQLVESVRFAADAAAEAGMSVMLEPLNPVEFPKYLLTGFDAALDVMERVARPNVALQFDVYHVAMMGENVLDIIDRASGLIGHVQLADVPGRHEPGSGALPFHEIIAALEHAGYRDAFALEFVPFDPGGVPDFSCVARLGGALVPH